MGDRWDSGINPANEGRGRFTLRKMSLEAKRKRQRLWRFLGNEWVRLIGILVVWKLVAGVGVAWLGWKLDAMRTTDFRRYMRRWPESAQEPVLESYFATWDGAHYLHLAKQGYWPDDPSCAFYPLFRGTAPVLGGNLVVTGMIWANVASLAGWLLFYAVVGRRWGRKVALWALALLVTFPGSLFYQFPYSEGFFFLLLMMLWWAVEQRRWIMAYGAGVLLPMTRGIGAFAVLPLGWQAIRQGVPERIRQIVQRKRWLRWIGAEPVPPHQRMRLWVVAVAPVIGWLLYLACMGVWTGNVWEGFVAQKHWHTHSVWHLIDVPGFLKAFFWDVQTWHAYRGSMLDRLVFLMALWTTPLLWKMDRNLLIWWYWLAVLPAMSGHCTSYTRFVSVAFPVFAALGWLFGQGKYRWTRWFRWIVLGIFLVGYGWLVWRFVRFQWAG